MKKKAKMYQTDVTYLKNIGGADLVDLILKKAPTKVASRVLKAADHINKALKLKGIDEEMGFIRLLAAEEEFVIAIFEQLKLNEKQLPEQRDFIKRFRDHQVKLSFPVVLAHFAHRLMDIYVHGVTLNDARKIGLKASLVPHKDRMVLRLSDDTGKTILDTNPLASEIALAVDGSSVNAETLFADLLDFVQDRAKMSLGTLISTRVDFRNKLLYADDSGFFDEPQDFSFAYNRHVVPTVQYMLNALAILLTNAPLNKDWGVVSQFIALYQRALSEYKLIKPKGAGTDAM
ncbi:hypothetical protein [Herbaspirillum seropedicae]|uniref:hypothetical protein n=1 Tax=Herbaspirillum seropedicae TaxID=964 RepID=UPI003FCCA7CB